jgi:hypothetical protein
VNSFWAILDIKAHEYISEEKLHKHIFIRINFVLFTFLLGSNFHDLMVESRPAEYNTLFTSSNATALTPKQCPALS